MADVGAVLERFLDPRWDTVVGTVREWMSIEYLHGRGPMGPMGPPGGGGPPGGPMISATLISVGPGGGTDPSTPPTEVESWKRMWVRRDGRSRVEHRIPGVDAPFLTEVRDPEGVITVRPDGGAMRSDPPLFQALPTWLLDPGTLLGLLRVTFGAEDEYAGRPVVHAVGAMRRELPPMAMSAGPMLYGMPIGGRSELTIDVDTGLLVRFATFEGNRLIGLRQFVELAVDEPVDEELLTFRLAPGQRFRTHWDDMLDMLRSEGEDVSAIDPSDEEAVQEAMQAYHERRRPFGVFGGRGAPRSLAELVAPMGPLPADPEGARASIEAAVAALPDDETPKASCVDHGEVFDRAAAAGGLPPRPSPVGDQTVTFVLTDHAFVRDDEALIAFEVRLSGGGRFPFKGRAVRRGERWLVAYETWAQLQEMGGTPAPSLLDEDPEQGP